MKHLLLFPVPYYVKRGTISKTEVAYANESLVSGEIYPKRAAITVVWGTGTIKLTHHSIL
jgi:hypothetical protein